MAIILRDRRLLPTFIALAVAAFLVIPMITTASVVNAQSVEDENPCEGVRQSDFEDRNRAATAHRRSIDCVDHYEITSGSGSRGQFFMPLARVDRAQMATFIVNTLEAAELGDRLPSGERPDEFDDISGSPHRGNINKLARIGVVRGTGGGNYTPEALIERDEMATFLLQAYEWAYQEEFDSNRDYFRDVRQSNTHFGNINAAYEEELVRGVEEPDGNEENSGRYNPQGDVLRQAMASFLVNLLAAVNTAPEQFCTASPSPTASSSPTSGGGGGLLPIGGGGGGGGSPSPSASASPGSTASPRPSSSASPTATASEGPTACATQSGSPSPRPSGSARPTSTASPTGSASPTPTSTASEEPCFPGPPPICG